MTAAGKARGKRTAKGRRRSDVKANPARAVGRFDAQSFRVQIRRPRDGKQALATLAVDGLVTEVTWARSGASIDGSITLREPDGRDVPNMVASGDVVRLMVQAVPGGQWLVVWELMAGKVEHTVGRTGEYTAPLSSKLSKAQQTKKGWRFKKDRQHAVGWRAHEVAISAARRMKVPLGRISRGRTRLKAITMKSAGLLDVVTKAYTLERTATGRRFDVSVARGVLDVTELRRPSYMVPFGRYITAAQLGDGVASDFCTAVKVTSVRKAKNGRKRSKIQTTYIDPDRVRRYGYVEGKVSEPNLASVAAARRFGKRWMARVKSPYKEITVSHPGIPWVQRGDAFDLQLKAAKLRQTVWVKSAEHTLSAGSYNMDVVLQTDDPWEADEKAAAKDRKKAAKARERKRRQSGSSEAALKRNVTAKGRRRS